MVNEHHSPDGPPSGLPEHPRVRHERTDASFGWILTLLLIGMVFAAVIHYVVLRFFLDYRNYQGTIKRSTFPMAVTPREGLPAEPRLEQVERMTGSDKTNVYARQLSKEQTLNSYGTTPEQGYLHVPIERAMRFLVEEKKFPVRREAPPGDPKRANGLVDAGGPNSGRLFREKP